MGIAGDQTQGLGSAFSNQRLHGWPEIGGREFEVENEFISGHSLKVKDQ